jgi:hypothetical protein
MSSYSLQFVSIHTCNAPFCAFEERKDGISQGKYESTRIVESVIKSVTTQEGQYGDARPKRARGKVRNKTECRAGVTVPRCGTSSHPEHYSLTPEEKVRNRRLGPEHGSGTQQKNRQGKAHDQVFRTFVRCLTPEPTSPVPKPREFRA